MPAEDKHSEYNANKDRPVSFLQIWLFPNQLNVTPRYDQITLDLENRKNKLQQIVSPNPEDAGTWIYQDAWFNMGLFDKDKTIDYSLQKAGNGVYCFGLSGSFIIDGEAVRKRDGLGVTDKDKISITSTEEGSELLIIDVAMHG